MRYLLMVLAAAGIVVSAFALHAHYSTRYLELPCDINAVWSCGLVNHSRYAEVLGVPVAMIGIIGYALLGVLAWFRKRLPLMILSIIALGIALYFTHIEEDVLHMWCLYCVMSQSIIALLSTLAVGWWRKSLADVLVFWASLGVAISAFLLHLHYLPHSDEVSSYTTSRWSCRAVNDGSYAVVLGVPVAMIGIIGYALLGALAWFRQRLPLMSMSIIALGISLHFTYVEAEVLHMWCLYCVMSQSIVAVITVLAIVWWYTCRCRRPKAPKPAA